IASANIAFDPASRQMSGTIVVDSTTGDSGSHARDKRMKNDELQAQAFPSITFEPKTYSGDLSLSGSSQIQVSGIFTLIGQPHPITVAMTIQIDGSRCTATGQFDVPYIAWGLKDPSMLMVKMQKQVHVDLLLTGQITHE
ncbi:MAG TPA: YceI family protein, partial [Acidobacteriaceae bacterium]|nr:YceI family protein [Acidobacteriaceae bacterium]